MTWVLAESIVTAIGGHGTTVLLNCRAIHGSLRIGPTARAHFCCRFIPSADSFAYTPSPIVRHMGDIERGQPAKYACFDPRPCELPPDFRAGYIPPWVVQKTDEEPVLTM
jgi:ectoine hydroxylase